MADPLDNTAWANLPQGQERNATAALVDAYRSIYGREPTELERSAGLSTFYNADPNFTNVAGGRSWVAQQKSYADNTPDKLYAKQQEEYKAKAPEHYGTVSEAYKSLLGRDATQQERDHFANLLSSGQTDAYEIQNILKALPEYQQGQDKTFQDQMSGQLAGYDSEYFQKNILPAIQSTYAKQGRSFDSSAFQAASTNAAQQQNIERQKYLANLSAQQYAGRQGNARSDYESYVNQLTGRQNAGIDAQYQGYLSGVKRAQDIQDYNTQAQAYAQYLARYGKRNNPIMGGLQGAASGALAGGMAGGPWGALAGGVAGGALGAYGSSGSY